MSLPIPGNTVMPSSMSSITIAVSSGERIRATGFTQINAAAGRSKPTARVNRPPMESPDTTTRSQRALNVSKASSAVENQSDQSVVIMSSTEVP